MLVDVFYFDPKTLLSADRTANETAEGQGTSNNQSDCTKEGAKSNQDDATPTTPAARPSGAEEQQTPFRSVEVTEALDNSKGDMNLQERRKNRIVGMSCSQKAKEMMSRFKPSLRSVGLCHHFAWCAIVGYSASVHYQNWLPALLQLPKLVTFHAATAIIG